MDFSIPVLLQLLHDANLLKPNSSKTKPELGGVSMRIIRPMYKPEADWTSAEKTELIEAVNELIKIKYVRNTLFANMGAHERGRFGLTDLGRRAVTTGKFDLIDHKDVLLVARRRSSDDGSDGMCKITLTERHNSWAAHMAFCASLIPTIPLIKINNVEMGNDQWLVVFLPTIDGFANSFSYTAARLSVPAYAVQYVSAPYVTVDTLASFFTEELLREIGQKSTKVVLVGQGFGFVLGLHIGLALEAAHFELQMVCVDCLPNHPSWHPNGLKKVTITDSRGILKNFLLMYEQPANEIIEVDSDDDEEQLSETDDETVLLAEAIKIIARKSDLGKNLISDAIMAYKRRLAMLHKFSIPKKLGVKILLFQSSKVPATAGRSLNVDTVKSATSVVVITIALATDLVHIITHDNFLEKLCAMTASSSTDKFLPEYGYRQSPAWKGNHSAIDCENELDLGKFLGMGRGIQGSETSSIVDAVLAAIFTFNPTLDDALHGTTDKKPRELVFFLRKLRESVVNALRKTHFVRADNIGELLVLYSKCQVNCTDETKGLEFVKSFLDLIVLDVPETHISWCRVVVTPSSDDTNPQSLAQLMNGQNIHVDSTTVFVMVERQPRDRTIVVPNGDISLGEADLNLFAVVAYQLDHYVCFSKSSASGNDAIWVKMDSKSERADNKPDGYFIPEMSVARNLNNCTTDAGVQELMGTFGRAKNLPPDQRSILDGTLLLVYHRL